MRTGPQSWAKPRDLMRGILARALGVPADTIELIYPTEER